MTVVSTTASTRTFLEAVNRALSAIGESDVATLLNPTTRVRAAMRYVNDARDEVFYRTLWEWRRAHMRVELVADTMWYDLPQDYHKMATGLSMNQKAGPLELVTYEKLIELYPDLRAFPPGSGVASLASISQLNEQAQNFGAPMRYCTVDGYLGLVPIPDEDFVEQEGYLYASYWRQAGALTSDNDDIGVSRQLYGVVDDLAAAGLKKNLEFDDWAADKAIGDRKLSRESSSDIETKNEDRYNQGSINYNE